MADLNTLPRKQQFYAGIAGEADSVPDPITIEEQWLKKIYENGSGSTSVQSDWKQTDDTAADYIKNKPTLGTAAAKGSTNAVTQNSTDLVESGAVKTAIDNAVMNVYKPSGDKTCAELVSALLVGTNLGNVYNITDKGTTTADFVGGAGNPINVGDNVAVVDVGTKQNPSYKFDNLAGLIDISDKADKVTSATAGNFAGLDSSGNLTDSGKKPADFATPSDVAAEEIASTSTSTSLTLTDSADGYLQGVTVKGHSRKSKALVSPLVNSVLSPADQSAGITIGTLNVDAGTEYVVYWEQDKSVSAISRDLMLFSVGGSDIYPNVLVSNNKGSNISRLTPSTSGQATVKYWVYQNSESFTASNFMICKASDYDADPTFEPYFSGIKSIGDAGWGVVDFGTLEWTYQSEYTRYVATLSTITDKDARTLTLNCQAYQTIDDGREWSAVPDKSICNGTSSTVIIKDTAYTDATTFKSAVSGVLLYYPLAEATGTDPLLGITSKNGAGQGTAATITTALPLRSVSDEIYDTADNTEVVTRISGGKINDTTFWIWEKDNNYSNSSRTVFVTIKNDCLFPSSNVLPSFLVTGFDLQTQSETWTPGHISFRVESNYIVIVTEPTITDVAGLLAAYGDEEIYYPLATPTETPLTSAEKSALASLRTYDHTTRIDATDEPSMTVDYLKNTENGKAVSKIENYLQSQISAIKQVIEDSPIGVSISNTIFSSIPAVDNVIVGGTE